MKESKVEKYLVKQVKLEGGQVRKVRFLDRRGAPDRVIFFPDGEIWWVELKAPGKKAEAHQKREHKRMAKMGQQVVVLDSLEAVDRFLT